MCQLNRIFRVFAFFLLISSSGCQLYKQDILFQLDESFTASDLAAPLGRANENYKLRIDDYILVDVYTNGGELILDPNNELRINQTRQNIKEISYLIENDGFVKLPVIDKVKLVDLTLSEAELILQQSYSSLYKECFVKITLTNKRVVILGAGGGQVIPMTNEHMTIAEVLALYGGLDMGAKAGNIRLIRGELSDPQVFQLDLTTVKGLKSTATEVMAGDIIYVEPWRRPWIESLRDISPILSIASSLVAFILVIQNIQNLG